MERLQKFEFEVIHKKGQYYENADRLSRRLCDTFGCEYYAKIEKKSAEEKMVACIVLANEDFKEWREAQQKDSSISFIIREKEVQRRPLHSEIPVKEGESCETIASVRGRAETILKEYKQRRKLKKRKKLVEENKKESGIKIKKEIRTIKKTVERKQTESIDGGPPDITAEELITGYKLMYGGDL